jgi:hypothetical protein
VYGIWRRPPPAPKPSGPGIWITPTLISSSEEEIDSDSSEEIEVRPYFNHAFAYNWDSEWSLSNSLIDDAHRVYGQFLETKSLDDPSEASPVHHYWKNELRKLEHVKLKRSRSKKRLQSTTQDSVFALKQSPCDKLSPQSILRRLEEIKIQEETHSVSVDACSLLNPGIDEAYSAHCQFIFRQEKKFPRFTGAANKQTRLYWMFERHKLWWWRQEPRRLAKKRLVAELAELRRNAKFAVQHATPIAHVSTTGHEASKEETTPEESDLFPKPKRFREDDEAGEVICSLFTRKIE